MKLPVLVAALIGASSSISWSAVTYTLGSLPSQIGASTVGLGDSSTGASGSFTTAALGGSAGISFDLTLTPAGGSLNNQSGGLGVSGGSANAGIDNDNAALDPVATDLESITIGIANFSGLALGETLVITQVTLGFGTLPGNAVAETYSIDGSGNILFTTEPEAVAVAAPSVTIAAGTAGDTKFTISSMTVEVVPEPTTPLLIGAGMLTFLLRRRRA